MTQRYLFVDFGIVFGQPGFATKAIPCATFACAVELAHKAKEWQILKFSRDAYRVLPIAEDKKLWAELER